MESEILKKMPMLGVHFFYAVNNQVGFAEKIKKQFPTLETVCLGCRGALGAWLRDLPEKQKQILADMLYVLNIDWRLAEKESVEDRIKKQFEKNKLSLETIATNTEEVLKECFNFSKKLDNIESQNNSILHLLKEIVEEMKK